jgi:hypothetical protein
MKSVASVMALSAVLLLAGVRTLHSEPVGFVHAVTKSAAAGVRACFLCDSPDFAIIPSAVWIAPPLTSKRRFAVRSQKAYSCIESIPLHVRPPPVA